MSTRTIYSADKIAQDNSLLKNDGLDASIASLRAKKTKVVGEMKLLRRQMALSDQLDPEKINQYVELNKQLRGIRIYEAEFCFIQNIL